MSVVSSVLSTRSSAWKINARVASLMDSIFAIGFGLGLRFVVDAVSHHDFKLTGTLVGLWEGIILLHFLKKMPKSTDPYIAYGVRLFVDFLCTESVARLVLVLIWTGMGMVLADITPALWDDVGLNRIWRRFRRDLYTISQTIPTVAFFPPPRTVRFSPSREHSIIPEEPSILDSQLPSTTTTEQTPASLTTAPAITTSTAPVARELLRRRVPGYFPVDYSDTDTDLGSIRAAPLPGRTSRRLSVYPQHDYDDSVTDLSSNLDEGNLSSGDSSVSTERGGQTLITFDTAVIPDMEVEEELLVDTAAVPVKDEEERTPRQAPMYLPPTPSDSAVRWHRNIEPEEPLPVRPLSSLPQIPDFLDEPTTEDLDKTQSQEAAEEKPPTPPAKDDLPSRFIPPMPTRPPPQPALLRDESWEILKAEFVAPETTTTTNDNRQSLPPSYRENDEFDDIYGDEYVEPTVNTTAMTNNFNDKGKGVDLGAQTSLIDDGIVSPLGAPFTFKFDPNAAATNPWTAGGPSTGEDLAEIARREEEEVVEVAAAAEEAEAEVLRKQEEEWAAAQAAAAQKEAEEAVEKKKKEEEAAEQERSKKEEEERKKKEEEKAERKRKEEADELARQQKRAEEEAAAKKKAEEEEAAKRKAEEEATKKAEEVAKKAKEAAEKKKAEEEEAARNAEEKQRKAEEKQKKLEEKERKAEEKRKKEEAKEAKKAELAEVAKVAAEADAKKQEEAAAQRKKEAAEAAERRERAMQEKEKREQEAAAREAEENRKQQEEQRKRAELTKAKAEEDAAVAASIAMALEEEKRQQEEQKVKEEADKAKDAQTGGEPLQPAAITSEEDPTPCPAPETTPKQRDLSPTPSSPEPTNAQAADTTVVPGDPVQAEESRKMPVDVADAESVVTEASEMPSTVGERLERLILLKAQMIDVRDRIEELKGELEDPGQDHASISEQLRLSEKVLKKMERKEQRRYTEGVAEHNYLQSDEADADDIMLNQMGPKEAGIKVEEKLEQLLQPGVETLQLTTTVGPARNKVRPKQKAKIVEILNDYCLFIYVREDKNNGRIMRINLSEQDFREWLLAYRAAATAAKNDDDDSW